jgi:dTDP-glucose 4,6-dehydratase
MHSTPEMECKIARCFAFVGPHLPIDAHFAIGNFIRDAIHGGDIFVKGDGSAIRSYQYASDLAICLWAVLFAGECNRAYNVGSEESTSIRTLADSVINSLQSEANVVLKRVLDSKHNANRYVPSTSRICKELGVTNQFPLNESIQKTARWWKHQLK